MHINFVQTGRTATSRLGWLVLAVGLVMTSIAAEQLLQWRQAQEVLLEARLQQVRTMAEQERQRLAALPPATPPYVDDKRWQRAASELALPWLSTLQAIEHATKPPVFLTGFKSDPVSGRLQLDAEAPAFEAALSYVSALQTQPGLANTQLLAHDESPDLQGHPLVKFSLQTKWVVAR
jgi:hypothetical protein